VKPRGVFYSSRRTETRHLSLCPATNASDCLVVLKVRTNSEWAIEQVQRIKLDFRYLAGPKLFLVVASGDSGQSCDFGPSGRSIQLILISQL
jgi:hypothetical protein